MYEIAISSKALNLPHFGTLAKTYSRKPLIHKMSASGGNSCFIKTICKWGARGIRSINWFPHSCSIQFHPCSMFQFASGIKIKRKTILETIGIGRVKKVHKNLLLTTSFGSNQNFLVKMIRMTKSSLLRVNPLNLFNRLPFRPLKAATVFHRWERERLSRFEIEGFSERSEKARGKAENLISELFRASNSIKLELHQ